MHQGCVAGANDGKEAGAGWWPTSRSCRWGGRSITPASWPPTTSSTRLATVSPQAAGTAPAPARWVCKASNRGGVPADVRRPSPRYRRAPRPPPRQGSCSGVRCGPATHQERVDPLRPRRSDHCSDGARGSSRRCPRGGRLLGRAPGRPPRPWRCPARCPDEGCWRSGSTIGRPGRGIRCCTPIWWWPTASKGRTDAGRRWTAGICTGIGWPRTQSTGPATSVSLSGRSAWSGRRRTPMATAR
jgi:hypothetical protein